MDEGVAQLSALMDRARRRHADVAGNAPRRRELAHQPVQAGVVGGHLGVDLRIGALQVHVGHYRWSSMAGPGDEEGVDIGPADETVQLGVHEVQPG